MALQLPPLPGFEVYKAGGKGNVLSALGDAIGGSMLAYEEGKKRKAQLEHQKLMDEIAKSQEKRQGEIHPLNLQSKRAQIEGLNIGNQQARLNLEYSPQEKFYNLEKSRLDIQQKQEEIKNLPEKTQSEIDYKNVMTEYYRKQNKAYDERISAEIAERKANARIREAEAERTERINKMMQEPPGQSSQASQPTFPGQQLDQSYGISIPKVTKEDIVNKQVHGFDTYSPKLKAAEEQIENQKKGQLARSMQSNKESEEAMKFEKQLDQYNHLMDEALFSGYLMGHGPSYGVAQQIDNIVNQMGLTGVQQMRNAMDSARFSNLDMSYSQGLKPNRTWDAPTRKRYTEFTKAVNKRLKEKRQFDTYVANHPELQLNNANQDALWSEYQDNFPVTTQKGDAVNYNNLNQWPRFLTKEAIDSVKEKGSYTGITAKDITEDNIKDTMKETGLSRKEVIKELEERGYVKKGQLK